MLRKIRGTIWPLALAGVALAFGVRSLDAQGSTPEGTQIINTATVSFTDANNNTYASVQAADTVTVGFAASVLVTGPAGPENPAPGSFDNSVTYSVQNLGNGTDGVSIDTVLSASGIITNLRYVYGPGPTTYNDLATLNAAIAAALLVQDTTITIEVLYDVAAGTGGQAVSLTFEATSTRDTNVSDDVVTDLTPAESIAVAVAPDSNLAADRLPNSPTVVNYTATFTVTNSGDGPETFDLVGSTDPGGAITIVSVNGGTASIALAATASQDVDVVYTIGDVAAGVIDTLILTATAQTAPNPSDRGHFTYRVVKPSISVAKDVFQADSASAIVGDSVVPNDVIWYMITVQNTGSAEAQSVQIVDTLPAQLTLVSANGRTAGNWTMTTVDTVNGIVVADLNAALPATESRYIWIQAQVK